VHYATISDFSNSKEDFLQQ